MTHFPEITDEIIGRESELAEIDSYFNSKNKILIVNGIGGIGKTSLCKAYYEKKNNIYNFKGYVPCSIDIKVSFIEAFKQSLKVNSTTIDDAFSEILVKLSNLEGENLLFIDNLQGSQQYNQINNLGNRFKLLITSREKLASDQNTFYIEELKDEDLIKLFYSYHPFKKELEPVVKKLIIHLGRHTLFVELTAKALANDSLLSIDTILTDFETGKFKDIKFDDKNTFNDYLNQRFTTDLLEKYYKTILSKIALLPSIETDKKNLLNYFGYKNDNEIRTISLTLNSLSKLGWLINYGDTFKLHQIIKEYLLANYQLSIDECTPQLKNIHSLCKNLRDDFQKRIVMLPTLHSILNIFKHNNRMVALLNDDLAQIYFYSGKQKEALKYELIALEMVKTEDYKFKINIYNSLSNIYYHLGENDDALKYINLALSHKSFLDALDLGMLNMTKAKMILNSKEALSYAKKAEEILIKQKSHLMEVYNTIASIYIDLFDEQAISYSKKAITIYEEKPSQSLSEYATSYNNLSLGYLNKYYHLNDIFDLDQALINALKSLKIREELSNNYFIANSQYNLALIYYNKKDIYSSARYLQLAYNYYVHNTKDNSMLFDIDVLDRNIKAICGYSFINKIKP